MNAAQTLLAQGVHGAEVAMRLSRDFKLSRRQAYRYLRQAQRLGHPVAVPAPSRAVTFKLPGDVIRALHNHSAASGLPLSEIVTRALVAFLAIDRDHG